MIATLAADMTRETVKYTTGGGVVCRDNQVLLLARPQKGEIRLPKGHIDPGEEPAETALRETVEETGYADLEIVADLGQTRVEFELEGRSYQRTEFYYLMELKSDRQTTRPIRDSAQFDPFWCPVGEGLQLLTFVEERAVLEKALATRRELAL